MKEETYYRAAVYLRLSREDEDAAASAQESSSIRSQRELICGYVSRQENMEIYDIYADSGFSGANFDRPQFQRMMEDIKAAKVNCVIVKDLSRLGRDYIEAGRLIQKIFPAFRVRFIALTDGFDSLTADFNETALILPVKNFINDSYCRDISVKVRSHLKVKRENGEFTGAFCVYGYRKSEENRNMLIPDAYASCIVKKIFLWRMEGLSAVAIARCLNECGILSPMEYKKIRGENYQTGFVTDVSAKWSAVAVKRILVNEIYIGNLVQGKREKISHKVKRTVEKPQEQWARMENTHKAIVAKEDFTAVQELFRIDARAAKGAEKAHKYTGLLFCADCGKPMIHRVKHQKGRDAVHYICSENNRSGGCSRHDLMQDTLDHIVMTGLKQQILLFMEHDRVSAQIQEQEVPFEELICFEQEIERMHRQKERYDFLQAALQEDLEHHIISKEDYHNYSRIYEKQQSQLQQAIVKQEKQLRRFFRSAVAAGMKLEQMKKTLQVQTADRITLLTFVKRISVYEDQRVYLEFCFQEPLQNYINAEIIKVTSL